MHRETYEQILSAEGQQLRELLASVPVHPDEEQYISKLWDRAAEMSYTMSDPALSPSALPFALRYNGLDQRYELYFKASNWLQFESDRLNRFSVAFASSELSLALEGDDQVPCAVAQLDSEGKEVQLAVLPVVTLYTSLCKVKAKNASVASGAIQDLSDHHPGQTEIDEPSGDKKCPIEKDELQFSCALLWPVSQARELLKIALEFWIAKQEVRESMLKYFATIERYLAIMTIADLNANVQKIVSPLDSSEARAVRTLNPDRVAGMRIAELANGVRMYYVQENSALANGECDKLQVVSIELELERIAKLTYLVDLAFVIYPKKLIDKYVF
eukprot:TRINITY_DN12_c0_g1_i2.p1 TRINITY_DN12_c0_g1~~TRINITY_DN12_c0_g1_i2.p1  ORF type:complete len:330 (-),score=27.88 TRINITY_DN12_c0_g1_i2:182-1171(-)